MQPARGGLSSDGDGVQVFQDFLSHCFYYGQFFHHQPARDVYMKCKKKNNKKILLAR